MRTLFFTILLTVANALFGQDYPKDVKKLYKEAHKYIEIDEFYNSYPILIKCNELYPDDPEINYWLGKMMIILNHQLHSIEHLEFAFNNGIQRPDLDLYLGEAYHHNHLFDKAINSYQKFLGLVKSQKKPDAELINDLERRIEMCGNGKLLVKSPVKVKISNLGSGVNTKFPDYVPVVSADEETMVFTSRRAGTTGGEKDFTDNQFFEDIYISQKVNGKWGKATQVGYGINTEEHDAAVAISQDGQDLIIYKEDKSNGTGDLYITNLDGEVWSTPKSLGKNVNSKYWEPSASLSSDERLLFFTSDRPEGLGGRDVYVSIRQLNGEYGPAINMGSKINTKYDEDAPFIHADGKTLYFSSKGHNSMGGFDIFECNIDELTGEVLTQPKNIGYPINTADDDIFFVWSADGRRAYFSSEREGGMGEKDLYMLEREEADAKLTVLKGKVLDCETNLPVASSIKVVDLTKSTEIGVYNSNKKTGNYVVILPAGKNYGVSFEARGYLFSSKNIDIPDLKNYQEYKDEVCLNKIKIGKAIVLRNVFFDYDKATLRPESQNELNRLVEILNNNPLIRIRIQGHTDSDGNDDYNLELSDNRAKSVVDFLIEKNIDSKRLEFKGFGESKPIAPNDSDENKQLNRRTEFEIIK